MKRKLLLSFLSFLIMPPCSLAQSDFHSEIISAYRQTSQAGMPPLANVVNNAIVAVPAGTHVMMELTSPLHTTSATKGSAVFLETVFPVIVNDQVLIPVHTRVLGVVTGERRPGRIRGKAQLSIQFNQLILPDNRNFLIAGDLQSLPGSRRDRTNGPKHTIEPVDQIDADVHTIVLSSGVGALAGSIGHVGIGTPEGALIGAGFGLAKVLFKRGNEISLYAGTRVEMVLQQPLALPPQPERISQETNMPPTDKK